MKIKFNISIADIDNLVKDQIDNLKKTIVNNLEYIGLEAVNHARIEGNYRDYTGNLRSSIGYVVVQNGKAGHEDFKVSGTGTGGKEGVNKGKAFIKSLIEMHTDNIALIIVAGMDYASAVESKKNVLASASLLVDRRLDELQQQGLIKRK